MQQLRFSNEQIVWQEVPNETSLAFLINGCPLGCKGCHSADSWKADSGVLLTEEYLQQRLTQYQGLISCVLFMGGEWQAETLIRLLKLVRQHGLKTCLYTGLERHELPQALIKHLTYLKTGRWIAERGGLNSLTTNQRFIDLRSGENLNPLFLKETTK
ncbi:anaerobic ribonucleoside-triphosphate reductase activating protein [Glaesserella sp.]|uniref:anaerobic ribonucleoside-triphosphate reductase activating protein n=1 Tax=Glaesserella sp. TaxID=2094731 RepID=UPI0035A115EC